MLFWELFGGLKNFLVVDLLRSGRIQPSEHPCRVSRFTWLCEGSLLYTLSSVTVTSCVSQEKDIKSAILRNMGWLLAIVRNNFKRRVDPKITLSCLEFFRTWALGLGLFPLL